jgi:hypothetical protein
VQQPQRALRLDEVELAAVEVAELLVAVEHVPKLPAHVVAIPG